MGGVLVDSCVGRVFRGQMYICLWERTSTVLVVHGHSTDVHACRWM